MSTPDKTMLIAPSGVPFEVESQYAPAFLRDGYRPVKDAADLALAQNRKALLDEQGGALGALKAGAEGAAEALTLGGSTWAETALGVDPAAIEARQELHPIAHGAGTVVGIAAPLLLTGGAAALEEAPMLAAGQATKLGATAAGVAEVASAERAAQGALGLAGKVSEFTAPSLISRVGDAAAGGLKAVLPEAETASRRIINSTLESAARGSAEGALYGVGEMNHEAALGHPPEGVGEVAGRVGLSALFGGGLGAGLGVLGGMAKEATPGIVKALENFQAKQYQKALGDLTPEVDAAGKAISVTEKMKAAERDLIKEATDLGILKGSFVSPEKALDRAAELARKTHNDMGNLFEAEKINPHPNPPLVATDMFLGSDSPAVDMLSRVAEGPEKNRIADAFLDIRNSAIDQATTNPRTGNLEAGYFPVSDAFKSFRKLDDLTNELQTKFDKQVADREAQRIAFRQQASGVGTAQEIEDFLTNYPSITEDLRSPHVVSRQIRDLVKDEIDDSLNQTFSPGVNLRLQWDKYKDAIAKVDDISKMLQKAREARQPVDFDPLTSNEVMSSLWGSPLQAAGVSALRYAAHALKDPGLTASMAGALKKVLKGGPKGMLDITAEEYAVAKDFDASLNAINGPWKTKMDPAVAKEQALREVAYRKQLRELAQPGRGTRVLSEEGAKAAAREGDRKEGAVGAPGRAEGERVPGRTGHTPFDELEGRTGVRGRGTAAEVDVEGPMAITALKGAMDDYGVKLTDAAESLLSGRIGRSLAAASVPEIIKRMDIVKSFANSPNLGDEVLGQLDDLGTHAPRSAGVAAQVMGNGINWLAQQMPQGRTDPFTGTSSPPSAPEMQAWNRKFEAVIDPIGAISGGADADTMDAIRTVYPRMATDVGAAVITAMSLADPKPSFQKIQQLSQITGVDLTPMSSVIQHPMAPMTPGIGHNLPVGMRAVPSKAGVSKADFAGDMRTPTQLLFGRR